MPVRGPVSPTGELVLAALARAKQGRPGECYYRENCLKSRDAGCEKKAERKKGGRWYSRRESLGGRLPAVDKVQARRHHLDAPEARPRLPRLVVQAELCAQWHIQRQNDSVVAQPALRLFLIHGSHKGAAGWVGVKWASRGGCTAMCGENGHAQLRCRQGEEDVRV